MSGLSDHSMTIKCVVAAIGADGAAGFYPCHVTLEQDEYDVGDHYELAEDAAKDSGYSGPAIVFDENDGPDWLFEQFNWSEVDTIVADDSE